jgi:hypothetical protein
MDNFFTIRPKRALKKSPTPPKEQVVKPVSGRVSIPSIKQSLGLVKGLVDFITPEFQYEYIPVIRKLYRVNSSVSLGINTIVELSNTGINIDFDDSVTPEMAKRMRDEITITSKKWVQGSPGLHGIINKMIAQVYIGGAISAENVIAPTLREGVRKVAFVNPEEIRVRYEEKEDNYEFYQVPKMQGPQDFANLGGIKLNPLTYTYLALMGDEDSPIGIPPILSALDDVYSQLKMLKNIGYVADQLGLLGFMEVLMEKPPANEGESDTAYAQRLSAFLDQTKTNVKDGTKDGYIVGYRDDHEFQFHSSTKDATGVSEIFDITHRMVGNGLYSHTAFLGGVSNGSDTMINVIFTKMLSQLNNVQTTVSHALSTLFTLHLLLRGYKFNHLSVKFKPSTITDELKAEQSEEIRVRNNQTKYYDGLIDIDQYAQAVGLKKADQREPRDPDKARGITSSAKDKEDREKDKDKSDRKVRDKNKSQPKRNDRSTKER